MSEQKPLGSHNFPQDFYTRELTPEEIAEIERLANGENLSVVPPEGNIPDLDITGFVDRSTADKTIDEDPPEEDNQ